ncbi:MAG: phenylalanine--tRNA ligase subunit beta [Planctomycetota bacterium]|nr:MAG: phenylalanine--tRNA ligase subunit beta [Planctomycetota bacterium]
MRISHQWLRDYVEHTLSPEQLAELLTRQAVPVEAIEPREDGDACLELEVTFNRHDLLCHIGVAHEVAAGERLRVRVPEPSLPEGREPVTAYTDVQLEAPRHCPLYTARVIRGVRVGPSPDWLVRRLEAVGLRPINNVVDVTNFVMFECGQPLHAFDLQRLAEGRIVVRTAREGESIELLDGSARTLDSDTLVIADAARPVALAGVMGGANSEIVDTTRDVLLESAYFDPVAIRRAVRRYRISTDSSYRFERGVDPARVAWASARAAALIAEIAGGTIAAGLLRREGDPAHMPAPREIRLRLARLRLLAGVEISRKEAARILHALGLEVIEQPEALTVRVPTARHELTREVDLIEEVLRVWGYDRVPVRETVAVRAVRPDPRREALARLRMVLVGAGLREVQTLSFVPADDVHDPPLFTKAPALRVRNPVRADTPALRRSLFGGLCEVKRGNLDRGNRTLRLFETGTVYLPQDDGRPEEREQLGLLLDGDFYELKGVLEAVGRALRLPSLACVPVRGELPGFDPLERAAVQLDGAPIGWIGRLGRAAAERFDLPEPLPVLALLDLETLLEAADLRRSYSPPPPYPAVTRDVAAVVDERVYVGELIEAARRSGADALEAVELLSVFEGDGKAVERGRKSVALRLVFRSPERTLRGEEADAGREAVKAALRERFGATFRE